MNRTKLIATLGPACESEAMVERLIEEGVSVFRLNFSHGTLEEHGAAMRRVRRASRRLGRPIAVMGDLCGPKIRLGEVAERTAGSTRRAGGMPLAAGDPLVIQREPIVGAGGRVSTNYSRFADEVRPGDRVLIDDGEIRLLAVEKHEHTVVCRCVRGGVIRSHKGVNLPDTDLSMRTITALDERCITWGVEQGVDYLALSFVRRAAEMHRLRELVRDAGAGAFPPHLIAKIEKPEAVRRIEGIIEASDAVMIARGDLGVEMDAAQVPILQKRLIRRCAAADRPVIVATQMLQSMIEGMSPTRAEVSDVANAVFDGADALMLSGETAVGRDPALAVHTMAHAARSVERHLLSEGWDTPDPASTAPPPVRDQDAVLAQGGWQMARHLGVKRVVVWSARGGIARLFSKLRPRAPVVALAADDRAVRRMALYFGVSPHRMDVPQSIIELTPLVERVLVDRDWARPGEHILIVGGTALSRPGKSNAIMVHRIDEPA